MVGPAPLEGKLDDVPPSKEALDMTMPLVDEMEELVLRDTALGGSEVVLGALVVISMTKDALSDDEDDDVISLV